MNKDFENEIRAIAQDSENDKVSSGSNVNSEDLRYLGAIEQLFSISEQAVDIFNTNSKNTNLSTYKLPNEFLEIFLEIPGRRCGFCIISATKLIILFDEDPDLITVIGKKRNTESGTNTSGNKVSQLLKATFIEDNGKYEYKDNTGGQIDPYDMVLLLIKWVVAA